MKEIIERATGAVGDQSFSYAPSQRFSKMVNPAFFASETESGLVSFGVLKLAGSFFTGFLHSGQ